MSASFDERRAACRAMIWHEDELRNQRLTWLFSLNGFLFAALSFAWEDASSTSLILVLVAVGITSAISVAGALKANTVAIANLARIERAMAAEEPDGVPVIGLRSDELARHGWTGRAARYVYPWRVVPACLVIAWAAVAVIRIAR